MNLKMGTIGVTGAAVIRALGVTWRMSVFDEHLLDAARERSPHVVFAVWHGRLLPLAFKHRNRHIHVLASEHADGEMLGQVIRRLGFGHVRGSSTRGGARAIRELARKVEAGFDVGLTVDGPRGPRHVAKSGAVEVARLSGAHIVPITTSSTRHKKFASWDSFELPAPFARVHVRYGQSIFVPGEADPEVVERKRIELEQILLEITDECDRAVAE